MKKLLFIPLLAILLVAFGAVWFYRNTGSVSADKNYKDFLITKGSSASQIGNKLEAAGLVKNALAFKIYLQFSGQAGSIQTGEFRLTPSFNLFQTVAQLLKGPTELWVTIPEGLRREEIATRFASGLSRDNSFTTEFLDLSRGKEGMLFPDTYLFPKDASPGGIVNKMFRTFGQRTSGLSASGGLNSDQRLILASILERETKTDEERPVVAGILINRLNAGIPLQVDASVQYAIGTPANWWPILTRADLEVNSKFNTYKFAGLPPSPISNPGLSSLKAAYSPAETGYLYYIHDAKGQIHYANTLAEHNANVAKYLGK